MTKLTEFYSTKKFAEYIDRVDVFYLLDYTYMYVDIHVPYLSPSPSLSHHVLPHSSTQGPKLSGECGHYHMDGELRMLKLVEGQREEPRSR